MGNLQPDFPTQISELQQISRALRDAVQQIMQQADPADSQLKADGSIVTATDHALQAALQQILQNLWPQIPLLGEEQSTEAQQQQLKSGCFWCLDPLDGTTNFSRQLPLYSVSLALINAGEPVLGIVYDPVRDEVFSALTDSPLFINEQPLEITERPEHLKQAIAFIDFKRLSEAMSTRLVTQSPYKSQRNIGTCALEWAWLAAGRAQLLLHGGEKLWDYAAGLVLLKAAGGSSSTLQGESIYRPSLQPRSICAAATHGLYQQWWDYLRQ